MLARCDGPTALSASQTATKQHFLKLRVRHVSFGATADGIDPRAPQTSGPALHAWLGVVQAVNVLPHVSLVHQVAADILSRVKHGSNCTGGD